MNSGDLFVIFTGLSRIMKNQIKIMGHLDISHDDNVNDKEIATQCGYIAESYLNEWRLLHDSKN